MLYERSGKNIIEHVNLPLENFNAGRNKISSNTTNGAPVLTGKTNKFIALFKGSVSHDVYGYHCLIHQQQLCAQKLDMKKLIADVMKVLNFIRSRGLNHQALKTYLEEFQSQYKNVIYFSKVRLLSKAATLKRF